jgi:hypothetical protein
MKKDTAMGFHVCAKPDKGFIHGRSDSLYSDKSSRDHIITRSDTGRGWAFPDAILYYIADCGWQPPMAFLEDLRALQDSDMKILQRQCLQTKSMTQQPSPNRIAYLSDDEVKNLEQKPWPEDAPLSMDQTISTLKKIYEQPQHQKIQYRGFKI